MEVTMTVEIPKGSNVKYEMKDGRLICDRVLHTPMNYIFNYGCFENTLAGDSDPLDAVLLSDTGFYPTCLINCRIVVVLITSDDNGLDEKIIVVPANNVDPRYENIKDISDLSASELEQIEFFFKNYKSLEKGKNVDVGEFKNSEEAVKIYEKSVDAYNYSQSEVTTEILREGQTVEVTTKRTIQETVQKFYPPTKTE